MNIREPHQYQGVRNQRRAHHRWRRLRKWFSGLLIIVIIAALIGYGSYARALPLVRGQSLLADSTAQSTEQVALNWPSQGEAAIGVLGQGVLAQTANIKSLPTASVAKLMVALTVLKKYPLKIGETGPTITVNQADVDSYNNYLAENGSVVSVQIGQKISQYQALQAMLLPSANNIAELLAVWAYGSMPNYLTAANEYSQDIGLLGSHFADASGFAPETVSTPRDLVLLGQKALEQPVLKQIFAQPTAQFPGVGTITNTNFMLGSDGIIGIKTGNTDQAGGCYLFAAEHRLPNNHVITVIGAIMGETSLYRALAAAPPLLSSFYLGFGSQVAVHKGQAVATYQTTWGSQAQAAAANDLVIYGWQGSSPKLTFEAANLGAPAALGSSAGQITATTAYGQASVPLVLKTALNAPTWQWRLFRH
ncbi:MAG: hypothetical protein ABI221_01965 [Candidatus Saccharimonadales bacterium]